MGSIDRLPKYHIDDGYMHRVCIPCAYNSGRRATVRATIGRPDIIHISIDTDSRRPYQNTEDGYLHLNTDQIQKDLAEDPENWVTGYRHKEALEIVAMVKEINKYYFADKLTVLSDEKEIAEKSFLHFRSIKDVICDIISAWREYHRMYDISWLFGEMYKPKLWTRLTGKIRYAASMLKKQYDQVEIVQPLSKARLGGTWQEFYADNSWLDEATALKGSRIYLA